MSNLLEVIKKAALEAVQASNPTTLVFGTVTNSSPLQISIDQKLVLDEDFLILTNNVKDHFVDMEVSSVTIGESVSGLAHKHTYKGETLETNIDTHKHDGVEAPGGTGQATPGTTTHKHDYEGETSEALGGDLSAVTKHKHDYKGKKKIKLYYGLKQGEKVILIKVQGGQKYIVLDRISELKTEGEWV